MKMIIIAAMVIFLMMIAELYKALLLNTNYDCGTYPIIIFASALVITMLFLVGKQHKWRKRK